MSEPDALLEKASGILGRCEALKEKIALGVADGTYSRHAAATALEKVYAAEGKARAALLVIGGLA